MVNTHTHTHTHTHTYIYVYIYILGTSFLVFEAFAPTSKALLMSLCLESSRWLCVKL